MKAIRRQVFIEFLEEKIAESKEGRDRAIEANVGNSAACYVAAMIAFQEVLNFINENG